MPLDNLTNIIDSLTELKHMYQLNLELLEQLAVTCDWLRSSGVKLPNESTFNSLLNKTTSLLDEIQADEPKILQYNISRRKVTDFRTDGEVTEPTQPLIRIKKSTALELENKKVCSTFISL